MKGDRTTRRQLLRTAGIVSAAVSTSGCLQVRETDASEPESETTDERDPDLRINGRYLSSAFPIELVDPDFEVSSGFGGDARLTYVHWHGADISHWHQSPLEIAAGGTLSGRTRFLEEGATGVPLGGESAYFQKIKPTTETPDGLVSISVDGAFVDIEATDGGEGSVVFELWTDEGRQWRAPPLPIDIG